MIEIKNLTFSYAENNIFEDINCRIDNSWHLALVGRNGRGKTTLLKLLQNTFEYSGQISTENNFVYFPQNVTDKENLLYYILHELADFEDWKLKRELNLLNFPQDGLWRPFNSLSGGEQTKALLAILFLDDNNFPLIDEPTNHLDKESREVVARYLMKKRQGYIVVSHDRSFLDEVSDHVIAIEKNQLVTYQGNFTTYETEKKLRDEFEFAKNEKLKKEIHRLKETAREKAAWSNKMENTKNRKVRGFDSEKKRVDKGAIGTQAARLMQKSKNAERRANKDLEEKEKLLKNLEYINVLGINYKPYRKDKVITFNEVTVAFEEGKPLFEPISFEINSGQITAIIGPNGIGKSQLLNKIYREAKNKNVKISRVRQIYEDNSGYIKDWAYKQNLDYQMLLNNLKKLGMERNVFKQKIENMSMGQQKKIELARSLSTPAELYIWDEPLNYLDVFNHEQIEELILQINPTMIVVEHDKFFIDKIANQIIELKREHLGE
ncbi:ribosomal protection-like ABC-F family protein [Floricoccus penangensis]|uniref:ribosomal protection-like ABC-F family protein n=1 Tax=Floricoccus penangensis TaxID=1859475 RepID=UPI00203CE8AE|nr:ABC-F type ribosomal protection protein [Floricoccus penangensis]URZ86912.1 ABC-F type ribosomal protection protein [Floricoccus penangensis]